MGKVGFVFVLLTLWATNQLLSPTPQPKIQIGEGTTNIETVTSSLFTSETSYLAETTISEKTNTSETTETSESDTSSCSSNFDRYGGIFVYIAIVLYCFVGLAILCEGELKDSIVKLAAVLRLSPDVAGATLMAAGTSSPELFAALVAVFSPENDIGTGTIVGSAIFNLLIIIGSCAVLSSFQFNLDWKPVTRDVIINIVSFVFLYLAFRDSVVTLWESVIGCILYTIYVIVLAFNGRIMNTMKYTALKLTGKVDCLTRFCYEKDLPEIAPSDRSSDHHDGDDDDQSLYNPLEVLAEDEEDEKRRGREERGEDGGEGGSGGDGGDGGDDFVVQFSAASVNLSSLPQEEEEKATDKEELLNKEAGEGFDHHQNQSHQSDNEIEDDFEEMMKKKKKKRKVEFSEEETTPAPHPLHHFHAFSSKSIRSKLWIILSFPYELIFYYSIPRVKGKYKHQYIGSFISSLIWLAFLSILMVNSAEKVGCILKIDGALMGTTVLAIGTSLPDCLASIAVAKTGRGNMAVCNALGSNIFDILVALCFPWTISIIVYQKPIQVGSDSLVEDVLILFGALSLFYLAMIVTKWKLGRRVGYFLVTLYLFFITYTLLRAVGIVKILQSYINPAYY